MNETQLIICVTILLVINIAISFPLYQLVINNVLNPFMDEPFHVEQTLEYCEGHWEDWNPKITTPPGLYVLSVGINWIFSTLIQTLFEPNWSMLELCRLGFFRAINTFIVSSETLFLITLIIADWKRSYPSVISSKKSSTATTTTILTSESTSSAITLSSPFIITRVLIIQLLPISFFFNFLYYTEPASQFFILLTLYTGLYRQSYWFASFFGLISLTFRQTNIVWIAWIAFISLEKHIDDTILIKGHSQLSTEHSLEAGLKQILYVLNRHWSSLVWRAFPWLLVALSFLIFLVWNGGIVLGDRSAHMAIFHGIQIGYFLGFAAIFLAPFTLKPSRLKTYFSSLFSSPTFLLTNIALTIGFMWLSYWTRFEHPYLLADNRHFSFYIWKDWFQAYAPYSHYIIAPGYTYALWSLNDMLIESNRGILWRLSLLIVTAAALVPSPLFEFRYFITPLIFFLLSLHQKNTCWSDYLTLGLYTFINCVVFYLFIFVPFRTPGMIGRFMW